MLKHLPRRPSRAKRCAMNYSVPVEISFHTWRLRRVQCFVFPLFTCIGIFVGNKKKMDGKDIHSSADYKNSVVVVDVRFALFLLHFARTHEPVYSRFRFRVRFVGHGCDHWWLSSPTFLFWYYSLVSQLHFPPPHARRNSVLRIDLLSVSATPGPAFSVADWSCFFKHFPLLSLRVLAATPFGFA